MDDRGGTLCLTFEDIDSLRAALAPGGFHYDVRGTCLRASFHAWNTPEQAALLGRALAESGLAFRPAA
jgi:hypothetical protein